ncbi:PfkB family carbohydrate kinase [Paenisporosarcina indica]|uniref:PfkB family carbohydrate kinase n=1 Tax=Paenisporosarcina indica TaxID=650093 RepID=UPI00094F7D5A|nr:PfkB family carbohydrate kinase [Paenisporosarcina indica]
MVHSYKTHVLTYGDAFVDYIAEDRTNTSFSMFLGGATVNVAVGVARLGVPSAFITITGDDPTSEFVRGELKFEEVIMEYAKLEPEKRVSGVYVHLTEDNDRVFHKYIDDAPDIQVEADDLIEEAFEKASILNLCSGTLFHPKALETSRIAVEFAKKHGALFSFDANIRPLRWSSEKQCRETISSFFKDADLLKFTREELAFLTETQTLEDGLAKLAPLEIPIILVTAGEEGTYAALNGQVQHVPVEPVVPVDTTGAGDAFMAGILRYVHLNGLPKTIKSLIECCTFANRLGALATTKAGALTAMPRLSDLNM